MTLDDIFGTQNNVSATQECARAALIFFYGLAVIRLSGRRVFAKWSALDAIVSVMAGSNLSRALTGGAPLRGTLAATTLLVALHWSLARLTVLFPRMSWLVEGAPVPLLEDGIVKERILLRQGVSRNDLGVALRMQGLEKETEARRLMLEPNGKFSVLKR
ncbi:DUF421 domain-containing protein [Methylocystis sp. MJC1]|uniref:DUF421 domain-containing protein n=1 Tax=Methylocystis sp. MJC1 TaxID=2654282 RepID=UPI0013E9ABD1|nr:YetF domain-containing protein [Methylocystis sp. MJC1]KAF2989994.1 hypothetical protein MJC1_02911 [Methylocystis sp. MJC1]MBU6528800.1 DUF421 domain-containing protein [Methylocystis sp. MJC1]UZX11685.1 DUF421 domain-containing protein [Methylocystis sp. MJC1]